MQCLERAERAKALPRALRVAGPLDTTALRDEIEGTEARTRPAPAGGERNRRGSPA